LALSRNRTIMDCNQHICEMFGATREQLVGQSFLILYPSVDEYERIGVRMLPILNTTGMYSDNRLMKRVDGYAKGEVFWCHVTGRALNRSEPHEAGIWTFEDLSSRRPVTAELTAREREVAAHLMDGLTSKEIGRALLISHRTVEIYRARLMRKYKASTTADLVHKLLAG
jgi:PAS domain S-box-containing protein